MKMRPFLAVLALIVGVAWSLPSFASKVHVTSMTGTAAGCTTTCSNQSVDCPNGGINSHGNKSEVCSYSGSYNPTSGLCECSCTKYRCNKAALICVEEGCFEGSIDFENEVIGN